MKDFTGGSEGKNNIFPLHTFSSLAKRWGVTRQVVQNWSKRHSDFPKPIHGYIDKEVNINFYSFADIEAYEKRRNLNKPLDK